MRNTQTPKTSTCFENILLVLLHVVTSKLWFSHAHVRLRILRAYRVRSSTLEWRQVFSGDYKQQSRDSTKRDEYFITPALGRSRAYLVHKLGAALARNSLLQLEQTNPTWIYSCILVVVRNSCSVLRDNVSLEFWWRVRRFFCKTNIVCL